MDMSRLRDLATSPTTKAESAQSPPTRHELGNGLPLRGTGPFPSQRASTPYLHTAIPKNLPPPRQPKSNVRNLTNMAVCSQLSHAEPVGFGVEPR